MATAGADRVLPPALALALAACGDGGAFVRGPETGFVHDRGAEGEFHLPETMGSGVALFDADGDGDLDLYAVQGGPLPGSAREHSGGERPVNRLYLGDGAGGLADATDSAGDAAHAGYGMGACAADVDGDGRDDLFVTNVGPDALLLATGDDARRFVDATPPALAADLWTTAAGFADVDRDGDLDLAVVGYLDWSVAMRDRLPREAQQNYPNVVLFEGLPDRLLLGDGRGGFEDVSEAWGFGRVPGRGLGLALVDVDLDGLVDAYVANDTDPNRLYLNRDGAGFEDATDASGASASVDGAYEAGMGVGVGDWNRDGLPDLLVTNFAGESDSLYENRGGGSFRERSRLVGLGAASIERLGFGVTVADLDADGFEDAFVSCGHVLAVRDPDDSPFPYRQPGQLLLGGADGRLAVGEPGPWLARPRVGRGLASGDLDGDLAPDLVGQTSGGPLVTALNRLPRGGAYVRVELAQPGRANRSSVGAVATLVLDDGTELVRWVRSGTGYLSQDDRRPTFGVPAGRTPTALRVRWPDGATSEHAPPPLGASTRVERR